MIRGVVKSVKGPPDPGGAPLGQHTERDGVGDSNGGRELQCAGWRSALPIGAGNIGIDLVHPSSAFPPIQRILATMADCCFGARPDHKC
jgi:hypothetical protein